MNKKELWKWGAVKIAKAVSNKKITADAKRFERTYRDESFQLPLHWSIE